MKKTDIYIVKILSVVFLLSLSLFFVGKTNAAAPGTNIQVCVGTSDTMPNLTDPTSPKILFETSGNPFNYYELTISRDSILATVVYDTGIQKYGSGGNPPDTYTLAVPKGLLPIDDTTYYYAVRVKDAYDWSPYAQGEFVLKGTQVECSSIVTFLDRAGQNETASGRLDNPMNIFAGLSFTSNPVKFADF